jgi:hypothetical protein
MTNIVAGTTSQFYLTQPNQETFRDIDVTDYGGTEYIIFITVYHYPPADDGREGSGGWIRLANFNFDTSDGSSSLYNYGGYDVAIEDVCGQYNAHEGSMYFVCTYASGLVGARRYPYLVHLTMPTMAFVKSVSMRMVLDPTSYQYGLKTNHYVIAHNVRVGDTIYYHGISKQTYGDAVSNRFAFV